jgi:hypothetical protein
MSGAFAGVKSRAISFLFCRLESPGVLEVKDIHYTEAWYGFTGVYLFYRGEPTFKSVMVDE